MAWNQITFLTHRDIAEALSDLLHENSALSVTLQEGGDEKIFEPALGETPLWEDTQVVALFEEDVSAEALIEILKKSLTTENFPKYEISKVEDQDWERAWLDDFKPMQFGKNLWIVPSVYEPTDEDAVNIILDPGLAFGTGTHPTTSLCLTWLDENKAEKDVVVDYGCGSGILAIAAAKLGAKQVHAVDIDPQAIEATEQNAKNNHVGELIKTYLPEQFDLKAADLLLANILANPLHELAEYFSRGVKPGGRIVLSGILSEQADQIVKKYSSWFDMAEPVFKEEWVLLAGIKR